MAEWIEIKRIELHEDLQPREKISERAVEEYKRLIDESDDQEEWPFRDPVTVFRVGGALFLTSGWTRLEAMREAGGKSVYADVVDGDLINAVEDACGSNADHGYRRNASDMRRAVEIMLRYCSDESEPWSDRRVAQACKVSHTYVNRIRKQLETDAAIKPTRSVKGTDGKIRKKVKPKPETKEPASKKSESKPEIEPTATTVDQQPEAEPLAQLGPCPVCNSDAWSLHDDGYECSRCGQPHGEPAGDIEEHDEEYTPSGESDRYEAADPPVSYKVPASAHKRATKSLATLTRAIQQCELSHLDMHLRVIHDNLNMCKPE